MPKRGSYRPVPEKKKKKTTTTRLDAHGRRPAARERSRRGMCPWHPGRRFYTRAPAQGQTPPPIF
uniref:Uncharacterized protein n=1 Tax=Human herpesvirus 2 TaxID=10310 RepID=A0A481TPH7_HHV2|nr:hypothetical protein [Human alphaherpesvirus 2]